MKFLSILLCCLLLTGCGAKTSPPDTATTPPVVLTVFSPNENADGFVETQVAVPEVSGDSIVEQLVSAGVLSEGAGIHTLEIITDFGATTLKADFNVVLQQCILPMGTSGEYVLLGSVVNTFLRAYHADTIFITVDGELLETGHAIYDQPLTFYPSFSE